MTKNYDYSCCDIEKRVPHRVPFFCKIHESITIYILDEVSARVVFMRFYRDLIFDGKIHETRHQITIPSFIFLYILLKTLDFTNFLHPAYSTECRIECHALKFCIKFYTTFKASATKSISLCFSSSVIYTYRFMVIPMLECPKLARYIIH